MYNFFKKTVLALLLVCALCAVTCLLACGQSHENPQYGQTGNNGSNEITLTGTDIKTLNLKIDGTNLSVTVSGKTQTYSFIDEITVADGASWKLYSDSDCTVEVVDKVVNLSVGDNVVYVAVTNGYNTKLYIATITYKPITYTVTFDTKGGTEVESQTVEEDRTITAPETSREGYSFVKWDYDFTQPITKNITATAEWSADVTLSSDGTVTGLNNDVSDLVVLSEYDGVAVKAIAENAFKNCSNLKSVTIPNCIKSFPEGVFSGCGGLTEMTIPFVGAEAETSLETARYPLGYLFGTDSYVGGIKTLQQYYYWQHNLDYEEYYIPKNLRKITITGESVTDFAFYNCNSLVSVTIGDNVTSIGQAAFNSCSSLTSVVIGSGVTEIGSLAFNNSNKLTEVVNRSGLTITKGDTDNGYAGYYALDVHDGESKIDDKDGYLFYTYDSVNYLLAYVGTETNLTLPNDYNGENYEIYTSAFAKSDSLKSVTIPNGVTSIGNAAFDGCNALISVTIDGEASVKDYAFYNCTALVSITVGESVTSIAGNAFFNCYKLIEVIDKSGLEIYKGGTNNNGYIGCYALDVHNGASKIDNVDGYLFYTYDQVNYLVGYAGTETDLTLPDNYNGKNYEIYKFAFYDNDSLTSIIVSDGITSIGKYAFAYCGELTSVTIGSDVTFIGGSAFSFSYSLDEVTFENKSGWYSISSTGTTNDLNLDDASQNATRLRQNSNAWKRN